MTDVLIMGGTDVTIAVAEAVLQAGLNLSGIVTVGDNFSISYAKSPVANVRYVNIPQWCDEHGVKVAAYTNYGDVLRQFDLTATSVCLVAGWYHMVPIKVRDRFEHGCIGFHASLLPQLRGGAPLNWGILAGLKETGVTMFQLCDGVDDGLIYGQEHFPIGQRAYIGELIEATAGASAALVRELLPGIVKGEVVPVAQVGKPSYGLQRRPEDGHINWHHSAEAIDRLVRAVSRPYPGAYTILEGQKLLIWSTEPVIDAPLVYGAPGQLTRLPGTDRPHVVTGDGILAIVDATDEAGKGVTDLLRKSGQKRFSA